MATNILENCYFSNDKIDKLWIGSMKTNGNSITYPIEFTTFSETNDSVLSVQFSETNQTFTIGGQTIMVNEIINLGDNIEFIEELEYGSQGKIYLKRIRFNIPNVNLLTTNQIKEFVMNSDGSLALTNTIAFLLDENGQTLCVGYDKPLVLRELNTDIGEDNSYELVYESRSPSRSRAYSPITNPSGVNILESSIDFVETGQTYQLIYTVSPFNANKAVTWESSDTDVATVSSTGLVTSVNEGTATITITTVDGGLTDTCDVNVEYEVFSHLIAYYRFDEVGTVVSDSVGGITLTRSGGSNIVGKNNSGVYLKADTDVITNNNSTDFNFGRLDPFTLSIWFKRTESGNVIRGLFEKVIRTTPFKGYSFGINSNNALFFEFFGNGTSNWIKVNSQNISTWLDLWQHIVLTYDGSGGGGGYIYAGVKMYVNGSAIATAVSVNTLGNNDTKGNGIFTIGNYFDGTTNYSAGGVVDEVGIWNRALTPTEIAELYNNGNGLFY